MATRLESSPTTDLVREVVAFSRLPWVRPLVNAHRHEFSRVAPLFAGDPQQSTAWADAIARVHRHTYPREGLADLVTRQLALRQAPDAARQMAATLAKPEAVAVVTGQQAGVFGGPLYTLFKAITTIQLAREVQARHGVPAVPVFWVDAEDHDWDEVCTTHLLDRDSQPTSVTLPPVDGCGTRSVATLVFDHGLGDALASVEQILPPTEFTAEVLEILRRCYHAGTTVSRAFATLMDVVLGPYGLVTFESDDRAAKTFASALFADELTQPGRTVRLAREGAAALSALGHTPQIQPDDDDTGLFYVGEQGREAIHARSGAYFVASQLRELSELLDEARQHPERFSPNVLTRPLVQDTLFPTICYVAGPSELAYHAQLGGLYAALGIPRPLLASRASATIVDSASQRFLDKHGLPFETLQPRDEAALNRLLEDLLPPAVEERFNEAERQAVEHAIRLKDVVVVVDPTLAGAVDTTVDKIRDTLKTLHGKIIQASKKKDETLRRQFVRTRNLCFPDGQPQERLLSVTFFLNRYGLAGVGRLVDGLPSGGDGHYLISL